ncbi:hypothetical protein BSF44_00410 [Pseudomonas sp. ACN8]|nr:hypothetical protein BSF44_00410 [Pseudomonas sp. ACN8]
MVAAAVTTVATMATVAAASAIATMATAPTVAAVTATATAIAATAASTTTTTTILGIGTGVMGNGIWYQNDGSRKDTANCQRQQSSLEKQVIVHRAFSW